MFKFTKDDLLALATMEFFIWVLAMVFLLGVVISVPDPMNTIIGSLTSLIEISVVIFFWAIVSFLDTSLVRKYPWLKFAISVLPIVAIGSIPIIVKWRFDSIISVIGLALVMFLVTFGLSIVYMLWIVFFEYFKNPSLRKGDNQKIVSSG